MFKSRLLIIVDPIEYIPSKQWLDSDPVSLAKNGPSLDIIFLDSNMVCLVGDCHLGEVDRFSFVIFGLVGL